MRKTIELDIDQSSTIIDIKVKIKDKIWIIVIEFDENLYMFRNRFLEHNSTVAQNNLNR